MPVTVIFQIQINRSAVCKCGTASKHRIIIHVQINGTAVISIHIAGNIKSRITSRTCYSSLIGINSVAIIVIIIYSSAA